MLNRISVSTLLKSVIVILALGVVVVLSNSAWHSWSRLAAVQRIATAAQASNYLFTALHNLRADRTFTARDLNSNETHAEVTPLLKKLRDANMPALRSALAVLATADFPQRQESVPRLREAVDKLEALQKATAAAFAQPKAARPQGLGKEYLDAANAVMMLVETVSGQLVQSVRLTDSYVDQLMDIKELAWVARNTGGDNAVMVTNGLNGQPLTQADATEYAVRDGEVETTWRSLETIASGLPVPARFTAALAKAKQEYFNREFTELRQRTVKELVAHQPVTLKYKSVEWAQFSIAKLTSLLEVAVAALDATEQYAEQQRADAYWQLVLELGFLAAAIVLVAGMMLMVTRRVTGPLVKIQEAMLKVATGDFSVVLPGLDRKDEIGDVSNAVERFKVLADEKARAEATEAVKRQQTESDRQAQIGRVEAEAQAKVAAERARAAEEQMRAVKALGVGLERLSGGDLTFRLTEAFPEAYKELRENFNDTMARLQETIRSLTESAREVTSASAEISGSTTDLSQRTEEQAASLEETSASMEEISATVKKNAENAQQANQSAGATRDVADRGGQVVAKAVEAMAKIEDSSRKISDIIGVIDEIARQTNLLALNAAVEAARAGEAGRGFAVVASEVRSLAQRSSQAAKDIKDLITNSNGQVKDGVDLVNRAGASLTEILESIKKVSEIVADIANASAEQASGIEQVNKALTQMDEVTQQNSALVEENAATAKTLENQSKAMDERVSFFKLDSAVEARQTAQPIVRAQRPAAEPKRASVGGNGASPVRRMLTQLATAVKAEPDWKEF